MSLLLGCDLGTQSAKAVLMDAEGRVHSSASATYGCEFPNPGWVEQDSSDWIDAVRHLIEELAASTTEPISLISIDAQVDGVVAANSDLEALHPAIIWMDRRSTEQAATIESALGSNRVFALTGLNCDPSHTAPKMMWLRETLKESPTHFLCPTTVVTSWLTGELAQDAANASSTMLFDVSTRQWSDELLSVCDIGTSQLPPVVRATDVLGTVRPSLADDLGLSPKCQVIVGTGDDFASTIAARVTQPGVIVDITGTAEPIGAISLTPVFDEEQLVETHAHAIDGQWLIENPGFASGGSTMWIASLLGIAQSAVFDHAAKSVPGANGVQFIPALSGSMSPRWDARARGSFTGLAMDTSPFDLCRAVIEGCCYAMRAVVDRLGALELASEDIHVVGGGARSQLWLQTKATVTGRRVRPFPAAGTEFGAASLGGCAAGWYDDIVSAAEVMTPNGEPVVDPDQSLRGLFDDGYDRHSATYDLLNPR